MRLYDPSLAEAAVNGTKPRRSGMTNPGSAIRLKRGDLTPLVLTVLREAEGPLPTRDIASTVVAVRGDNAKELRPEIITSRFSAMLNCFLALGARVRQVAVNGEGRPSWEVSR